MRVEAENGATAGKQTLLNVQKLLTLTLSMIQFMKWQEMKQDTEKHSLVFLRDTSENNSIGKSHKINLLKGEPLRFSLFIRSYFYHWKLNWISPEVWQPDLSEHSA